MLELAVYAFLDLHEVQSHTDLISNLYVELLEHPSRHCDRVIVDFASRCASNVCSWREMSNVNKNRVLVSRLFVSHLLRYTVFIMVSVECVLINCKMSLDCTNIHEEALFLVWQLGVFPLDFQKLRLSLWVKSVDERLGYDDSVRIVVHLIFVALGFWKNSSQNIVFLLLTNSELVLFNHFRR